MGDFNDFVLHLGFTMNQNVPAGLQVGEGDGRVWEADLFTFFIPCVAVLSGRDLFDLAVIALSFTLIPIAAVVTCGGQQSLSTTPGRHTQVTPDKSSVFVTHQLLALLVQKLSGLRSDLLGVFLDRLHLPLTSVAKHAVLVDLRGDKPEL